MSLNVSQLKKEIIIAKRRLWRFCYFSNKLKFLLIIVFFLMGIVRLAILFIPFRFIAPTIGEKRAESPVEVNCSIYAKASKVGWAVNRMSQFTPWESKCLVQAITAQIVLRLIKIPYTLYLGLDKDQSNKLVAHAWLRCGELMVTGGREKKRFVTVAQFARFSKDND